MILIENFSQVAAQIESERGITKLDLIDAISQALISASRRKFTEETILEAKIDHLTGEVKIFQKKLVVKKVENPEIEIALKDAKKEFPEIKVDEYYVKEVTPTDFGRIAAQTAKQVIIQRIREAEKNSIFKEFKDKIGGIITGVVQRIENRNYLINLGRIEAVLGLNDQIPNERFNVKDKVRLFIVGINKNNRGSFIQISRSHPGLIKKLFEMEVPEIQDNVIEIVNVAREAGERTKIAVKSNNPAVTAVGTCVGPMGTRIQNILREIGKEKIDILDWHEDPKIFISNALKPAKIKEIIIANKEEKTSIAVVPKDQLSLAIGKFGVNVRLAVKLTGWKIDIMDDDEFAKKESEIRKATHVSIVDRIKQEKEKNMQESALLSAEQAESVATKEIENKELPEVKKEKKGKAKTTKSKTVKVETEKSEKTKKAVKKTKKE